MSQEIEFSLWDSVPILIGAAISIVTSVVVFTLTSWLETRRRTRAEKEKNALLAFKGLRKLLAIANDIWNLKRHIDEQFDEANQTGRSELEPFQKVRELVGADIALAPLHFDEVMFLSEMKLMHVIDEIDLLYIRALNCRAVSKKYNDLIAKLDEFLLASASDMQVRDGTRVTFEVDADVHKRVELNGARLNELLGDLMESLDADYSKAKALCELFMQSGHAFFGSDFPKAKLEWGSK